MKVIHTSGKRKSSIAKATLKPGKGAVKINNKSLDHYTPEMAKLKIQEPLLLSKDLMNKVDISIRVSGGGYMSQADAVRLCIAKALVEHKKDLKQTFLDYDRALLVADTRRKETKKPNRSGRARAKKPKGKR